MRTLLLDVRFLCALAAVCFFIHPDANGTVVFSVSPSTVSNTYIGNITWSITGLTNGETVTVQQFLDVNTNGVIDGPDLLGGQGQLTDGLAMAFGGVTNLNVPGDFDSMTGQITAQLAFQTAFGYRDYFQSIVGNYLIRLSSPTGRFPPQTNSFAVTDANFGQGFTGKVQCNSTNVPYALVLLMTAPNKSGMAQTMTDTNGNYTLTAPPGNYQLIAAKNNFVMNSNGAASAILNSGFTITTNLTLIAATQSISGKVVDSATTNGLGGICVAANDKNNGLIAITFTDSNGNFNVPVTASSRWTISCQQLTLATYDHLGLQRSNYPVVNTTTGSVSGVTIAVPLGTAIIYGSVKDDQQHSISGLRLYVSDSSNTYETQAVTDTKGNYYASAFAGSWNISFDLVVPLLANYVMTNVSGVTATNFQATELNFVLPIVGEPYISQPVNLSAGHFGFNLAGSPGTNYTVLACTNLATTNWFTVMTTNLTASPALIQDNQATNRSRLYRAVKQ